MGMMGNGMETAIVCWRYMEMIEKRMETTRIVCWSYMGIMEKSTETTKWDVVKIMILFRIPIIDTAPKI